MPSFKRGTFSVVKPFPCKILMAKILKEYHHSSKRKMSFINSRAGIRMIGIFASVFPSLQVQEAAEVTEGVLRKIQTNPLLPSDPVLQTFLSPKRNKDSEHKRKPC